jgi:hypothetical protein
LARPKGGYQLADGTDVPGTTTAIKTLSESEGLIHWAWKLGMQKINYKDVRNKAADVGTITHDLIEQHLTGGPEPESAQNARRNDYEKACRAFNAWREWLDTHDIHVEAFERPLVSERYRFGGTPDSLGRRGNGPLVILPDWKTSKNVYPEYLAQMGGYAVLLEECGIAQIEESVVLRADKEKDMTWEAIWIGPEQLKQAKRAFLAALKAYEAREALKVTLKEIKLA